MADSYPDLYFTREQLFLSDEETIAVAQEFWGTAPPALTDIDRAFVQRALLIAVDASEKAGFLFDVYSSFVKAAPKRSIQSLVKSLAKKTAKRWFKKYIDDDPKYSAVGKSAVQYSAMTTDWKLRVSMGDDSMMPVYLVQ
jgi:hypothetical protein